MSGRKLTHGLEDCALLQQETSILTLDTFVEPSYLVILAAFVTHNNIDPARIHIKSHHIRSYLETIGFHQILHNQELSVCRPNLGKNYSMLSSLDNESVTEIANQQIISCINHFTNNRRSDGLDKLKEVIGELHDNVWSHGMCRGFSMVQRYNSNGHDEMVFAIADTGGGFLRELNRIGGIAGVANHSQAIEWCIQKGHSSKKIEGEKEDGWAQQLPSDIIGNPMRGLARYRKENNHAGLGLAKLVELIDYYDGSLQIISGDALLSRHLHKTTIQPISLFWNGVVICFKLPYHGLKVAAIKESVDELHSILSKIIEDYRKE